MDKKARCTYDTDISYPTEVVPSSVLIDVHKASLFTQEMLLRAECKVFLNTETKSVCSS